MGKVLGNCFVGCVSYTGNCLCVLRVLTQRSATTDGQHKSRLHWTWLPELFFFALAIARVGQPPPRLQLLMLGNKLLCAW